MRSYYYVRTYYTANTVLCTYHKYCSMHDILIKLNYHLAACMYTYLCRYMYAAYMLSTYTLHTCIVHVYCMYRYVCTVYTIGAHKCTSYTTYAGVYCTHVVMYRQYSNVLSAWSPRVCDMCVDSVGHAIFSATIARTMYRIRTYMALKKGHSTN